MLDCVVRVCEQFPEMGVTDEEPVKKPWYMISPFGRFKPVWDWFVIVLVVYNAVVVPLQVAFASSSWTSSGGFTGVDVFVDVAFIVDIGISLVTGYLGKWGAPVYSYKYVPHEVLGVL